MENNGKPSWNDAPEWAEWLAQDEDGEWYWFGCEPYTKDCTWVMDDGRASKAGFSEVDGDWSNTLERRPNPANEPMTPEEEELGRSMFNEIKEGFDHLAKASDMVNHPPHYQLREGYEVYDLRQDLAKKAAEAGVPHDQYSDWDRALEYAIRCWQKNGVEDLKKARWYLDKLIGKMGG